MIRRTVKGISWHAWESLDREGITAGTTCRKTAEGQEFNLALSGEDPHARENRKRLTAALGIREKAFTAGSQVHGCTSRILPARRQEDLAGTDALILTDSSLLGVILTADCLPVVLYDRRRKIGAVIHAGWKGAAGGIVPLTLNRMTGELGCRREDLLAGTGPAIGPCCYQVDRPVFDAFTRHCPETAAAFRQDGPGHWTLSLEEAVTIQLRKEGIPPENMETAGLCTCCDPDFFSWRGDGPGTGRIGTFLRTCKSH